MEAAARKKALRDARKAQAGYERQVAKAREARRESFERAQAAGFSLREIASEVGLHYTRVGEILKGK
jgi:hypothetical protein